MNDRIRISDNDRERAASMLRDHYAEGRLTAEELDERVTAALNAKTAGDLRRLMADLPGPAQAQPGPVFGPAPWAVRRRGPRLLPLALLILFAALLLPGGGWVLFAFLKLFLLFWLLVAVVGMIAGFTFRHWMRRAFRNRGGPLTGERWGWGSGEGWAARRGWGPSRGRSAGRDW
jgi:hypothetical protein